MAFLAGDIITAQRANRLQPATYYANASGTVAASQSGVTVPGCSINFTTETNGATVVIEWFGSFYAGGTAPTALGSCRAIIDGSTGAPVYAVADIRTANEKLTAAASWTTTIATAGAHTCILQATTPANMTMSVYTGISVTVYEVV